MDFDFTDSFASSSYTFLAAIFEELRSKANAEDLNLQGRSAIAWGLIRCFRLLFVPAWVLSMVLLFHVAAVVISRKAAETRVDSLAAREPVYVDEKKFVDDETELQGNAKGTEGWFHIDYLKTTRISRGLQRFVRGTTISFLYYSLLFGLLIAFDSILNLKKVYLRLTAFIVSSMLVAPVHMFWTHTLTTERLPDRGFSGPQLRHVVTRRNFGALLLPSLLYSASQVSILVVPYLVAMVLPEPRLLGDIWMLLSMVLIPTSMALAFVFVLMPAMVLLVRTEAFLIARSESSGMLTGGCLPLAINEKGRKDADTGFALVEVVRSIDFMTLQRCLKWCLVFIAAFVANIVVLVQF